MSSPATLELSTKASAATGLRDALRGAIKRVTWRVVGATLAIAVALQAWTVMDVIFASDPKPPVAIAYSSATIVNLLMVFSIMFSTLIADERVARGAKRLPAYAWAVVIGSAVGASAQWEGHEWLQLRTGYDVPGIADELIVMHPVVVFLEYLTWGSIIVFIYINGRSALLATTRMNVARVERADAQRRTLESRLQALQARVEPQFLFATLVQVRALYEGDPAKGGQMLGDLIVYLRAALPHVRESTSTLGREMDLVGAYFNIMCVQLGRHLALHVDVPDETRAARMPSMVLLPLIARALTHGLAPFAGSGTIRISARGAADRLRVEIADSGQSFAAGTESDDLREIRDRLRALYGGEGTLAFEPRGSDGTRAVMEVPNESANGDPR